VAPGATGVLRICAGDNQSLAGVSYKVWVLASLVKWSTTGETWFTLNPDLVGPIGVGLGLGTSASADDVLAALHSVGQDTWYSQIDVSQASEVRKLAQSLGGTYLGDPAVSGTFPEGAAVCENITGFGPGVLFVQTTVSDSWRGAPLDAVVTTLPGADGYLAELLLKQDPSAAPPPPTPTVIDSPSASGPASPSPSMSVSPKPSKAPSTTPKPSASPTDKIAFTGTDLGIMGAGLTLFGLGLVCGFCARKVRRSR
jgi:hypothetical protein